MSEVLKISKDKRHRSSSSLAGTTLEGTRSERKLDLNGASIPEVEDQFAVAEARCDDLQEKIDMIKLLKRKKKLKKRSMTKVTDHPAPVIENVPFITVRTQPKKKVSQQAARLHRLQIAPNPTRGYLDPATVEQHQMIGQMRSQESQHENQNHLAQDNKSYTKTRTRRSHAEGDNMSSQAVQMSSDRPQSVATRNPELVDMYKSPAELSATAKKPTVNLDSRYQARTPIRRRHVPRDVPVRQQAKPPKWVDDSADEAEAWQEAQDIRLSSPVQRRIPTRSQGNNVAIVNEVDERPVVELFTKNRSAAASPEIRRSQPASASIGKKSKERKVREIHRYDDENMTGPLEDLDSHNIRKEVPRHPRRVKYRSRRYELPTVASQMKQAGMRYYYGTANSTNIPFVVSKSTAPSHNIGVNIQQVLNGLKIQQPLSGIPLTIAHHMGLGHVPHYGTKSAVIQPSLDNREINVIKLGQKQLHLPSYKYMSYNRLLSLYREGDGMVPRFLRAISRPHYFYTSMYNLTSNRDDFDGATSKGHGGGQEAKQSLAEYANLYREYEHIDKRIREGPCEPELERRKDELKRQLEAREQHIRRVVQEYRASGEAVQPLRASASTAEDTYRHSSYKLNVGDSQQ